MPIPISGQVDKHPRGARRHKTFIFSTKRFNPRHWLALPSAASLIKNPRLGISKRNHSSQPETQVSPTVPQNKPPDAFRMTSTFFQAYMIGWAVAAPIGPVNLEIIRRALRYRPLAGFLVGVGATLVDLTYCLLTGFGLAGILRHPTALFVSLILGGFLMAWLAWMAGRDAYIEWHKPQHSRITGTGHEKTSQDEIKHPPYLQSWLVGVGMTALNPMTIVFWGTLPGLLYQGTQPSPHEVFMIAFLAWAGCTSWIILLMVLLHIGKRLVGHRLLSIASAAGCIAMTWFALRFWWLAIHLEKITPGGMTN